MLRFSLSVLLVALPLAAPAHAQTVVSSMPEWNGLTSLNPVGPGVQVLGQTFTAPEGVTTLDTFRTRVDISSSFTGARVYVFAMSGNQPTGSPLYRSDPIADPGAPAGTFSLLEFTGMAAPVTPGQEYVVFFSNAGSNTTGLTNSLFASPLNAAASPLLGRIVAISFPRTNPEVDVASLTTLPYNTILAPRDLAIELTFIPVPGAVAVAALGALTLARRRR